VNDINGTILAWPDQSAAALPVVLAVQALLSLRPEPFIPTATAHKQNRRRKRRGREAPASNHRIRVGDGSRAGRCGSGTPNPPRDINILGANGYSHRGKETLPTSVLKQITERRTLRAREQRRIGRPERRAICRKAICDWERAHKAEIAVTTHNAWTMAVDGKHGVGRAAEVLGEYQ